MSAVGSSQTVLRNDSSPGLVLVLYMRFKNKIKEHTRPLSSDVCFHTNIYQFHRPTNGYFCYLKDLGEPHSDTTVQTTAAHRQAVVEDESRRRQTLQLCVRSVQFSTQLLHSMCAEVKWILQIISIPVWYWKEAVFGSGFPLTNEPSTNEEAHAGKMILGWASNQTQLETSTKLYKQFYIEIHQISHLMHLFQFQVLKAHKANEGQCGQCRGALSFDSTYHLI